MMFALRDMTFDRVNLLMNDLAAGLPSPMAFLGLASSIAPAVGCDRWAPRVLPILHEVHVDRGRTKPEQVMKSGVLVGGDIPEDLIGSIRVSMLLDMPECDDENALREALFSITLAGGHLRSNGDIKPIAVSGDGASLSRIPRGYAVLPFEGKKPPLVSSGAENIETFFNALYPEEKKGWRVPLSAGYRLIEDPEKPVQRRGVRNADVPHVFAEPLMGLGELVSIRNRDRLVPLSEEELKSRMWSWTVKDDLILGHKDYLTT